MSRRIVEVEEFYEKIDEDMRLKSKAGQIEFVTNIHYIEKYLKKGDRILDLGAGTGIYSLYLASRGYEVTSVELVEKHVEIIKDKVTSDMRIDVIKGDALDLSMIKGKFDIIICFGPLYHLEKLEDQKLCLMEILKLSRDETKLFLSFISNDMVIVTETMLYNPKFLLSDLYNHETFRLKNIPINFHRIDDCRELIESVNLNIIEEVASDGLSELLAESINNMDEYSYKKWLEYHLYTSNKKEFLANSNHWLFVVEN